GHCLFANAQQTGIASISHSQNSLSEIADKQRALLIVFRSTIIDARDNQQAIIDSALRADPRPRRGYQMAYGAMAKKLNSYIRKYRSLSAASEIGDADYVIGFNLVEFRHVLNVTYPYGELFVITKGNPEAQILPRVIWKSKKVEWAED